MGCQGSFVNKGPPIVSHPASSGHQHTTPTPSGKADLDYSPLSCPRPWRETLDLDRTEPRTWPGSSPQCLIFHMRVAFT